jgi:MoxR-vWA-beta-propeller ternary system domain bpX2
MQELIFTLNKKDKNSLGNIRCMAAIKIADGEDYIWIRGLYDNGEPEKSIRQLPIQHSYYIDENNLLFTAGSLTPVATLPELVWLPVAAFISIKIPVAALPGKVKEPSTINVLPSAIEKKSTALLTTLQQWKAYAELAPGIRLAQLHFAVSQKNEVLITGTPLPSIPGKEYWKANNILLPCGYDFEIPMAANFINNKLNPQQDGLLIFDTDGTCQKIDFAFLVPAKRSAVRLTEIINE